MQDAFLSRISATGSVLWVKELSTNMPVWRLERDAAGNSFIAAEVPRGGTDFGGTSLTNTSGFTLPLVAKLDSFGDVVWTKTGRPAGTNADYNAAWGMAVAPSGAVYFGGPAYTDFDLDSWPVRPRNGDAFLARIDPEPPVLSIGRESSSRTLSWSTNQAAFVLESRDSLLTPWEVTPDVIWRVGRSFQVTNQIEKAAEFFRLRLNE